MSAGTVAQRSCWRRRFAPKKLLQLAASSHNIPGVSLGLSDCTLGRDCYLLGRHQLLMFIWSAVRFIWMVAAGLPTPNSARFGSRRGSSFVENRWSHIHHERTCKAQRTDWFRMAAAVTPRRTIISKRARGRFRSSLLTVANRNMPAKQKAKMYVAGSVVLSKFCGSLRVWLLQSANQLHVRPVTMSRIVVRTTSYRLAIPP